MFFSDSLGIDFIHSQRGKPRFSKPSCKKDRAWTFPKVALKKEKAKKQPVARGGHRAISPDEKLKVAFRCMRSTCPCQNVQNTPKTHHFRTTFGRSNAEKVHAVMARSTFPLQNIETHHFRTIFGRSHAEKVLPEAHVQVR